MVRAEWGGHSRKRERVDVLRPGGRVHRLAHCVCVSKDRAAALGLVQQDPRASLGGR